MHSPRVLLLAVASLAVFLPRIAAEADADVAVTTLTKVGDPVPEFTAVDLKGETWSRARLQGKVAVLALFATWCPACKVELPHVEQELWQAARERGLVVLAVAREEGPDKLRPFAAKLGLTFPLLADPDRKVFDQFATAYIPRLYVIGADGRIQFQSAGFTEAEFREAVAVANRELARAAH